MRGMVGEARFPPIAARGARFAGREPDVVRLASDTASERVPPRRGGSRRLSSDGACAGCTAPPVPPPPSAVYKAGVGYATSGGNHELGGGLSLNLHF